MTTIEVVPVAQLHQVRAFYEANGYRGGAAGGDLVLAARVDGMLAGVVRLCLEQGVIVLRGMQVDPRCQRQGIGRALLARCVPHLNRGEAWCLPYVHLVDFYGRAGFAPAPPEALPPFLAQRLAGYLAQGLRVLAMRRCPAREAR